MPALQTLTALPGSIKIGPVVYAVELEAGLTMENGEGQTIPLYGKVDFKRGIITIESELTQVMQWQCFWHEVIHVIFEQLGLEQDCEGQVDALAYKFLEILMDLGLIQFPEAQALSSAGKADAGECLF